MVTFPSSLPVIDRSTILNKADFFWAFIWSWVLVAAYVVLVARLTTDGTIVIPLRQSLAVHAITILGIVVILTVTIPFVIAALQITGNITGWALLCAMRAWVVLAGQFMMTLPLKALSLVSARLIWVKFPWTVRQETSHRLTTVRMAAAHVVELATVTQQVHLHLPRSYYYPSFDLDPSYYNKL